MARRELPNGKKLPPNSWLYKYPKNFIQTPSKYPKKCSWCDTEFWIVGGRWRICPACDTTTEEKK